MIVVVVPVVVDVVIVLLRVSQVEGFFPRQSWEDGRESPILRGDGASGAGGQRPPDKLFLEDMCSGNMTSRRIYPPESRCVLWEPNQICFL